MGKTLIIAEAGKNFINCTCGGHSASFSLENAKDLALAAKKSGADVVKFQTHVFEDEQKKRDKSRHAWIVRNESVTPYDGFWKPLKQYCDEIGIEFLTTPMSKMAAIKVNDLVSRWKVGSADIVDYDLLDYLRSTRKPIIMSTGMSTEEEIYKAVEFLGDSLEIINYCVSAYPCPIYKVNLGRIRELGVYNKSVGWSDHTLSVEIPALAVRAGAVSVEKHFTLDRNAFGPDHKVSLLPNEFKIMVEYIREAEKEDEGVIGKELWEKFRA